MGREGSIFHEQVSVIVEMVGLGICVISAVCVYVCVSFPCVEVCFALYMFVFIKLLSTVCSAPLPYPSPRII